MRGRDRSKERPKRSRSRGNMTAGQERATAALARSRRAVHIDQEYKVKFTAHADMPWGMSCGRAFPILVEKVAESGQARDNDVKAGDVVLEVDGESIKKNNYSAVFDWLKQGKSTTVIFGKIDTEGPPPRTGGRFPVRNSRVDERTFARGGRIPQARGGSRSPRRMERRRSRSRGRRDERKRSRGRDAKGREGSAGARRKKVEGKSASSSRSPSAPREQLKSMVEVDGQKAESPPPPVSEDEVEDDSSKGDGGKPDAPSDKED